jgi:hypothetical protein
MRNFVANRRSTKLKRPIYRLSATRNRQEGLRSPKRAESEAKLEVEARGRAGEEVEARRKAEEEQRQAEVERRGREADVKRAKAKSQEDQAQRRGEVEAARKAEAERKRAEVERPVRGARGLRVKPDRSLSDVIGRGLEIILTRSGVVDGHSAAMPADDVDLTLMIREGQNSVGQNDSVVRALEIILMRSGGADPPLSERGPNGIVPSRVAACRRQCPRNRPHRNEGADPTLVGEGPERHHPKSRRSLPPSMPSTVTPRTSSIFTKAAALVVVPTQYFLRLRDGSSPCPSLHVRGPWP